MEIEIIDGTRHLHVNDLNSLEAMKIGREEILYRRNITYLSIEGILLNDRHLLNTREKFLNNCGQHYQSYGSKFS